MAVRSISSIIMMSVAALLPYIIYKSDTAIGHWTQSSENFFIMIKTYAFLVLMVLLLPSLGLTS